MSLASEIAGRVLRLPAPLTRDVVHERDLRAVMDDGAVLYADRYAPAGVDAPPTVLVRSPYGRRQIFGLLYGRLFAERGFQVVIQSVRGTFGSEGEFSPMDERADGRATLRWLAEQPWHRGPLGLMGASYMGIVQWAVARDAGDAIGAMALTVTASEFHSAAYGGGSVSLDLALSWMLILALQERRLAPLRVGRALRALPRRLDQLPLGELDHVVIGNQVDYFRDWVEYSAPDDPYWATRDFTADVRETTAPAQLVGGWQDIFLPWMVEDWRALRERGTETQLVIGPWGHMSPGLAGASARQGLAWLRAHLLGDRRLLRDAPVQVWVSGEDAWHALGDWPPPGAAELRLFLGPHWSLSPDPPGATAQPDGYRYDPLDPTPAVGGPVLLAPAPVVDQAPLEARADVLTYTTAPLERDVVAMGPVRAELHVRSSLGFFDVFARVCDVDRDGISRNVCDALVRLTPGEPAAEPEHGVLPVVFDLWPTAHRFRAGHRIRLQVSSGAHPRYARNPGTGEPPATATELLASDQEVFHDPAHPSAVVLTVVDGHAAEPGGTSAHA